MNDKTMQNKYKKNIFKVLAIAISVSIISITAGTSYAILNGTAVSDNEQVIKAGTVTLRLTEHFDNLDNGVRIMADPDGLISGTTYNFTIKNIGSVPAEYTLKLENEVPNSYSGQVLSTNYFKVGLEINGEEHGPMGLQDVNNIIDKNTLTVNEVNSYKLRIWLDKAQESALEGKEDYNAFLKLKVEAKQNTTVTREPVNYVYSWDDTYLELYQPLAGGTYTGYCFIYEAEGSSHSSCDGYEGGYITLNQCQKKKANFDAINPAWTTSCQTGSWLAQGASYTTDASTLNEDFYLKYNIGSQTETLEKYVCVVSNNKEYCIKGGDEEYDSTIGEFRSPSYESNKTILDKAFGSGNCSESTQTNNIEYWCYGATHSYSFVEAVATPDGYVSIYTYDNDYLGCSIQKDGSSECHDQNLS